MNIGEPGLLVLPYTDKQYDFLNSVQDRLHSLNSELVEFLSQFINPESPSDTEITRESIMLARDASGIKHGSILSLITKFE